MSSPFCERQRRADFLETECKFPLFFRRTPLLFPPAGLRFAEHCRYRSVELRVRAIRSGAEGAKNIPLALRKNIVLEADSRVLPMEGVAPAEDLKFGPRLAISRVNRDGSFRSRLLVWRADAAAEIGGPPLYVPAKHWIMRGNKQRCFGVRVPLWTISPSTTALRNTAPSAAGRLSLTAAASAPTRKELRCCVRPVLAAPAPVVTASRIRPSASAIQSQASQVQRSVQIARSPCSSVRMRMTSSRLVTKILPSPMLPVCALRVMAWTTEAT